MAMRAAAAVLHGMAEEYLARTSMILSYIRDLRLSVSSSCYCDIKYSHCNQAPVKASKHFSLLNSVTNKCALVKTKCAKFIANREPSMIYIYKPFQRVYSRTMVGREHTGISNNVTPHPVWTLVWNASRSEPTSAATDIN